MGVGDADHVVVIVEIDVGSQNANDASVISVLSAGAWKVWTDPAGSYRYEPAVLTTSGDSRQIHRPDWVSRRPSFSRSFEKPRLCRLSLLGKRRSVAGSSFPIGSDGKSYRAHLHQAFHHPPEYRFERDASTRDTKCSYEGRVAVPRHVMNVTISGRETYVWRRDDICRAVGCRLLSHRGIGGTCCPAPSEHLPSTRWRHGGSAAEPAAPNATESGFHQMIGRKCSR